MKSVNSILSQYDDTIFEVFSKLAKKHNSINLGQGFPDLDGPDSLKDIAASAMLSSTNQYPPMCGLPGLRKAVAEHDLRFYGLKVDWETEVLITSGATEALADCMMGLIEPGDEVVLFEPSYDCYAPIIKRAGGILKTIRLKPPTWQLPVKELEASFSKNTKLILINTPHNPSGKMFMSSELEIISSLILKYDTYAVCDEVYEHIIFDNREHISLMSLPRMRDRCIRIGSAGKTFSMTGWKVGYLTASANLLSIISKAHQFITFTTPPMLQTAVSHGLAMGDTYFNSIGADLQEKRDHLACGLNEAGFEVLDTQGTYFLIADIARTGLDLTDVNFCEMMTKKAGVTMLPISAFYSASGDNKDIPSNYVRFCFAKANDLLDLASKKLKTFIFNQN